MLLRAPQISAAVAFALWLASSPAFSARLGAISSAGAATCAKISYDLPVGPEPELRSDFDPSRAYTSAEIAENIWAVHATDVIPSSGVMTPGYRSVDGKGPSDLLLGVRSTLHWALGELVHSHSQGRWEDLAFAVLVPLSALREQLVNLNTYDTEIVGPFRIPPEAILVVREDYVGQLPEGVNYYSFDKGTKLRYAVDNVLAQRQAWHVRSEDFANELGTINGVNVNTPDFFRDWINDPASPVSFGQHYLSERGEADVLGLLDIVPTDTQKAITGDADDISTADLQLRRTLVELYIQKLSDFPPALQRTQGWQFLQGRINDLRKRTWMFDLELRLRTQLNKSLQYDPGSVNRYSAEGRARSQSYEAMMAGLNLKALTLSSPSSEAFCEAALKLLDLSLLAAPEEPKPFGGGNDRNQYRAKQAATDFVIRLLPLDAKTVRQLQQAQPAAFSSVRTPPGLLLLDYAVRRSLLKGEFSSDHVAFLSEVLEQLQAQGQRADAQSELSLLIYQYQHRQNLSANLDRLRGMPAVAALLK